MLKKHIIRTTKNFYTLTSDDTKLAVYYSYATPVAIKCQLTNTYFVAQNQWSSTTGKHLTWVDGGGAHKKTRLNPADWTAAKLLFGVHSKVFNQIDFLSPTLSKICDLIADVGTTKNNGFTFSELSEPTDITNELWK